MLFGLTVLLPVSDFCFGKENRSGIIWRVIYKQCLPYMKGKQAIIKIIPGQHRVYLCNCGSTRQDQSKNIS